MNIPLYRLKYNIKYYIGVLKTQLYNRKLRIDYDSSVIILLACDYNNVGDALIRIAQERFVKNTYDSKNVITISLHDTFFYLKDILRNATKNTVIIFTGGGNTDDRYTEMERVRNLVASRLQKCGCRIIGFPQTIDYSNMEVGRFYLSKAQKAYGQNDNFTFFAREKTSLDIARASFSRSKVFLAPDIVLSLDTIDKKNTRNGIGLIMRNDLEKNNTSFSLNSFLSQVNEGIYETDMVVDDFDKSKLPIYVKQKMHFISSRKVVITDRLHAMILCYLTNTPCLVFPNANHKIQGTYTQWLDNRQNFIIMEHGLSDLRSISADYNHLLNLKEIHKESLLSQFGSLKKVLLGK